VRIAERRERAPNVAIRMMRIHGSLNGRGYRLSEGEGWPRSLGGTSADITLRCGFDSSSDEEKS